MTTLSDNAVRMGLSFFRTKGSTLRFGGEGAQMAITPQAQAALDELISAGAVEPIEPDCLWPGRLHYGSTGWDWAAELETRPHLNPFKDPVPFASFTRIAPQASEGAAIAFDLNGC